MVGAGCGNYIDIGTCHTYTRRFSEGSDLLVNVESAITIGVDGVRQVSSQGKDLPSIVLLWTS